MSGWRIGGIAAAVFVFIGSFLPWATVDTFFGSFSANGMDGDGRITLVLGLAAGVLVGLWKRPTVIIAAVLSGFVVLIALVDLVDLGRAAGDGLGLADVSPGIGLILTLLAGIAGVAVAFVGQMQLAKEGHATGLSLAELNRGAALPMTSLPPQGGAGMPMGAPVSAPPMAAAPAVPAGWHPDPTVPGQLRYWDGSQWTAHVQAAPSAAPVAPPAPQAPAAPPAPPAPPAAPMTPPPPPPAPPSA